MAEFILEHGDCLQLMKKVESNSIDMIFADPPYNLSGKYHLTTHSGKVAKLHKGDWDIIENIHEFNESWLKECVRVLANTGTIWISGTLHNHPSIGVLLKKLKLWIINDVIWYKRNATPLLSRNRLAPSTELIWVASKTKRYYFDYQTAKTINGGKQMRNLWEINAQRHKTKHPTEKPESLMDRIIRISTKENHTILDPFMGSGTTGVVAIKLKRNFIGHELNEEYFNIAKNRITNDNIIKDKKIDLYTTSIEHLPLFVKESKVKYSIKKNKIKASKLKRKTKIPVNKKLSLYK